MRLHEAVHKAEMEVAGKYVELVEKLREESAEELGRQVRKGERTRLGGTGGREDYGREERGGLSVCNVCMYVWWARGRSLWLPQSCVTIPP